MVAADTNASGDQSIASDGAPIVAKHRCLLARAAGGIAQGALWGALLGYITYGSSYNGGYVIRALTWSVVLGMCSPVLSAIASSLVRRLIPKSWASDSKTDPPLKRIPVRQAAAILVAGIALVIFTETYFFGWGNRRQVVSKKLAASTTA